ncbi:MAG TPA: D-arabinono-1,4-lactone oxidase, partial [Gammaproteobacteria bacterium]|nr:D-arabinono-1,4-lactone oxidase [Gammaproteobacteria bacterium]
QNIAISHWTPVSLKTKSTRMNATARHLSQERAIRYSKKFHIEEILTTYPNVIPFYMNYIVSKFGLEKESVTVRPWYDIAHSQTSFPKNLDDAGYLFSTDKDGKEVIQALNQVTDALNLYAKNKKYPLTYAIYVRFFQGTRGGLSTSQHADQQYVCAFDMVSHPTIPGYLEFKKDMQHFFMNELHAKPHWGKHIPLEVDYAKMYGENFVSFKKSLSDWYKDCKMDIQKSPFLNTFHSTILQIPEKVKPIFERDKKPPLSHEKLHPQHVKKFAGQLFNEVRKDKTNPAAEEFLQVLKKIR